MRQKTSFKILVTSPKGGVGKSTISANLAAYLQANGQSVTLLDFDNHGSSSSWLKRAPNIGVVVQHQPLPLTQGGNRSMLEARLHLRRAAVSADVVICDLTWSNSIAGELMFEFDLVIVPTSVSEIELAATVGFLSHHHWVFNSAIHTPPLLLLSPTRVQVEQLDGDVFTKQRFPVRFILPPPVLEAQSAKAMFERGYLMDMTDECGRSFVEFAKAVIETQSMREATQKIRKIQTTATIPKRGVLDRSNSMSSRDLLLGRHRCQKSVPNDDALNPKKDEPLKPVTGNIVSRFINRLTAGAI
jgi:CobQ/CobB/MinD/ParA nucleotide binding domain